MKATLWGKHYWFVIHAIANKYPEYPTDDDRRAHKDLFTELWRFLPCKLCSDHYKEHMARMPIDSHLSSREALFEWTVKLHNAVNQSLNKQVMSLSDAIAHYSLPNGGAYKECAGQDMIGQHEYALHLLMGINVGMIVLIVAFMVWMWQARHSK